MTKKFQGKIEDLLVLGEFLMSSLKKDLDDFSSFSSVFTVDYITGIETKIKSCKELISSSSVTKELKTVTKQLYDKSKSLRVKLNILEGYLKLGSNDLDVTVEDVGLKNVRSDITRYNTEGLVSNMQKTINVVKRNMSVFQIVIIAFAGLLILFSGCDCDGQTRKGKNKGTSFVDTVKPSPKIETINVYIENSGSMDGYVNGNTEFKGAIRDLLVMMKYHYSEDKIKIFYINDAIHEAPSIGIDIANFAQTINVKSYKIGNTKSTNLNHVFNLILDKTDDKTVSILFSDCIYSISGSATENLLSDEKSLTKDAFLSKSKQSGMNLMTIIVKMMSKFNGTYYNKNYRGLVDAGKHSTRLNGEQRPYYICVIGNKDILTDFNSKIELKTGKIEGFDNKYILSSNDLQNIYYSVLQSTFNKGRFKPLRTSTRADRAIHGIESVNLPRGVSQLTFAIAVNFNNISVEDDYILNPLNYDVPTDNFAVKEIFHVDKNQIMANDWNRITNNNPTHIIVLEAKSRSVSDVSLVLKKQMPEWIKQSSISDDTNIHQYLDKTFGLKYMVEGIAEAYQAIYPNDNNYFECRIEIKR
jgi:hypothetical protein